MQPATPVTPPAVPIHLHRKGRGTAWAIAHRFERDEREAFDDGWGTLEQAATEERLAPGHGEAGY